MSRNRGIWMVGGPALALAAVLALIGFATAGAKTPKQRVNSFAGSCSVQGTDTFTPPATNTLQTLAVDYQAEGTCSGTLNGRNVSDTPVSLHSIHRNVNGSCPYAQTTEPGTGTIAFADGTTIRYTVEFTSVLTEVDMTIRGQRSGSATGHATFLTPRTTPEVALECAGDGASEVPMDMSLTTDSPLVSDRHR